MSGRAQGLEVGLQDVGKDVWTPDGPGWLTRAEPGLATVWVTMWDRSQRVVPRKDVRVAGDYSRMINQVDEYTSFSLQQSFRWAKSPGECREKLVDEAYRELDTAGIADEETALRIVGRLLAAAWLPKE